MSIGRALRMINPSTGWTVPDAVLWYYGNDLTSGKWTDRTGNGNHATFHGSPAMSAADGMTTSVGNMANIPDSPTMASSGALCAWVKPTSIPSTGFAIGAWSPTEYYLGINTGGYCLVGYASKGSQSPNSVSLNTWGHLIMRWTGTQIIAYLDGSPDLSPYNYSSSTSASQKLWFGGRDDNDLVLRGQLDDVWVFDEDPGFNVLDDIRLNSPGSHA